MASPSLDLMCCVFRNLDGKNVTPSNITFQILQSSSFNVRKIIMFGYMFCITLFLSATLSTMGAGFTLMPKRRTHRSRTDAVNDVRPRRILSWLAASDLLACIGIMGLAIFTLAELTEMDPSIYPWDDYSKGEALVCIILTAWVQFFYLGTYFWTFWYAVDVLLKVKKSRINGKLLFRAYFVTTWLITSVGIFSGIWFLYKTDNYELSCSTKRDSQLNLLPLFLVSFIPLVLVFFCNPVLYWLSAKEVSPLLRQGGVYTDKERRMEEQIQRKFLAIVVVFTVCWFPNLINGVLLLYQVMADDTQWENMGLIYGILWICMAILNPLQAFLNSLVYWGPAGCTWITTHHSCGINHHRDPSDYPRLLRSQPPYDVSDENSALIG